MVSLPINLLNMASNSVVYLVTYFAIAHCSVVDQRKIHTPVAVNNGSAIIPDKYIAGGYPAEIRQFPWIARLLIADRSKSVTYLCAGSLIGARHVLSAAHCFDHDIKQSKDVTIYLGEYDIKTYPKDCARGKCTKNEIVYPDKIIKHGDYNRSSSGWADDIALLRLEKRVFHSAYMKFVPLPPFDIDKPDKKDAPVAIIGWGLTETLQLSDVLLATKLNLIAKYECKKKAPKVPAKHLCAGSHYGQGTCGGDSGGPLLMYYKNKFYISGIVSYGPRMKCGTADIGFFTNVFKYVKWIKHHMKA